MVSPQEPVAGAPMRVVAATLAEESAAGDPGRAGGGAVDLQITHRPGVPAAVIGALTPAAAGTITVIVGRDGVGIGCATIKVRSSAPAGPRAAGRAVWPLARTWSGAEEALFSAWVRELFHAEPGEDLAYRSLDEVTREADRNLLHNALAWDEDSAGSPPPSACAPTAPTRPTSSGPTSRGSAGSPSRSASARAGPRARRARCGPPISNLSAEQGSGPQAGELGAVQHFFRRTLAWGCTPAMAGSPSTTRARISTRSASIAAGSGPGRSTPIPTATSWWFASSSIRSESAPGSSMRSTASPTGRSPASASGRATSSGGRWPGGCTPATAGSPSTTRARISTRSASLDAGSGDVSMEQAKLDGVAFYDRMEALITPGTRDPFLALEEAVTALHEAAKVRVTSVDNGERHFAGGGGSIAMPDGYKIFETTGAWENFSTPARDLRLLVAIDLVNGFADKVRRQPEVFGVGPGPDQAERLARVIARLEARRAELVREPRFRFEYTRMDGSTQTVGLDELLGRAPALEMAYNPNECPELRWGAAEGSKEASTCRRRIPADQRAKMDRYRVWFRERRRPARGAMEP
ncbi:MAG: hypothetical protein H6710_21515 [Myxococcales bacterium]|nr:hypothetical protein [Myxococcales bacterium]